MALVIDGRFGEGGGQVVRTALAAILQGPVRIKNIRGGRSKQGLRPQHLMAVKALALVASAHVEGAALGSKELYFKPGRPKGGTPSLWALPVQRAWFSRPSCRPFFSPTSLPK